MSCASGSWTVSGAPHSALGALSPRMALAGCDRILIMSPVGFQSWKALQPGVISVCSLYLVRHNNSPETVKYSELLAQGFKADFLWPGTADWTAWAAVPTALAVQRAWGFDNMRRHNLELLHSALQLLDKAFGLEAVLGASRLCCQVLSAATDVALHNACQDHLCTCQRLHELFQTAWV